MKTSTKILIALGVVLFVFPVGAVLYDSMANRVDTKVYAEAINKEGKDPQAADRFLKTHSLARFNSVHILGENEPYVSIHLVNSDHYAVKVNKESDASFSYQIDASGILNISINRIGRTYSLKSIYVFAPNLTDLSLSRVQIGNLQTDGDSLNIKGVGLRNEMRFGENKSLKYLNINLKNSNVQFDSELENSKVKINELVGLKTLQLHLDSSIVDLKSKNYENLDAQLNASRLINSNRGNNEDSKFTIENLHLNTNGKSKVSFNDNLIINHVEGKLSDSTTTNLPIYKIRSLLK